MDMGKLVTLGFSFLNGKFRILEFKQLNHFDHHESLRVLVTSRKLSATDMQNAEKYNSGLLQANPA